MAARDVLFDAFNPFLIAFSIHFFQFKHSVRQIFGDSVQQKLICSCDTFIADNDNSSADV